MRKIISLIIINIALFTSCNSNSSKNKIASADSSQSKLPEELKLLNTQILDAPNNADLYNKRANYFYTHNNYPAALYDAEQAFKIDSTKTDYILTLSDIYFVTNQTSKSKKMLEKCLTLDPKNSDALVKLAEMYLYVNKNKESIEYLNKALEVNQYDAKVYFMKGMNYKALKDTMRAISSMQTAVEQDKTYYHAFIQLGILFAAQKNNLAIQYYKNAIAIQPQSREAWYDLAKFYQDTNDWNNALNTYNNLLIFDSENYSALYNIAVVNMIGLKKYDNAIVKLNESIKYNPKYVEAYYARGVCYLRKDNTKSAIDDFRACLALVPNYEAAAIELKKLNVN
jgi:tetratricopeptide (TPR) repeat protein